MFNPRNLRPGRPATNRHQKARGREFLSHGPTALIGNADAICCREASPTGDQLNAGLLQKSEMEGIEPIHLGAHPTQEIRHIRTHRTDLKAVGRGIRQLMAGLGAVHQKLFGNTAADHAGAADAIALHDGDAGSMTGRAFRSGQTTGACSEHNQIQISAHNRRVLETTGVIVKMALWSGEGGHKGPRRVGRISTASLNHEPFFQAPQAAA